MNSWASWLSAKPPPSHAAQTTPPAAPEKPTRCSGEPHAAQAPSAGAKPATPQDDARDDATARANERRDEAASKDRTLAQGVDHALDGDHGQQKPDDGDARRASDAHRVQRPVSEQDQAREQALRNIPDDPGGLLRAKIRRQYAERRYSQQEAIPSW
jgi:Ca-activated chloride channel family protein